MSSGHQNAKAGLFQPLIQLLQPRIERQLVSECRQLAEQALDGVTAESAPKSWLKSAVDQPCRTLARPLSECLVRETSRSGRELEVLTELLRGRVGERARGDRALPGLPDWSAPIQPESESHSGTDGAIPSVMHQQFMVCEGTSLHQSPCL